MRRLLQYLLNGPLTRMADRLSAAPRKDIVFRSLSELYALSGDDKSSRMKVVEANLSDAKFIILSDQHKGDKSWGDDFKSCETNYLAALKYYNENNFNFIALGDTEELWKFRADKILPANEKALSAEAAFQPDRFFKTFGNHDLIWKNKLDVLFWLKKYFTMPLQVYEGMVIRLQTGTGYLNVFLTHGHQGDGQSDGNPFSAWFVGRIWAPLQAYLNLNPNIPSANDHLKTAHNLFMYEWSEQDKNPVLITGHTHQPVFASLTHLERLYKKIYGARNKNDEAEIASLNAIIHFNQHDYDYVVSNYSKVKPYYFNSGCCCFNDGDITGIEIAENKIRLIKWHKNENIIERVLLEEMPLKDLL